MIQQEGGKVMLKRFTALDEDRQNMHFVGNLYIVDDVVMELQSADGIY